MKNQLQFKGLIIVLISFFSFFACDSDDDSNNLLTRVGNGQVDSGVDQGVSVTRDFFGKVVNETDTAVANAMVSIGTQNVMTNANGIFILNGVSVNKKQAIIKIEKTGYLKGLKTVVPTEGTNTINVKLVAENVVATVASGVASQVALPNGTKVSFDGNFKDANGNAYSGNVDVLIYHLEASNPDIEAIMPGNLQAVNSNNDERVLETYGMLNVELRGSTNQKLNIADGSTAEIELFIDPAQNNAPSSIPLWSFNETSGLWEEEGMAVKQANMYVATVSHFSWWNCDAQFPTVSLCLNVVDTANNPLASVKVELWRANAIYPRSGYSNGDGEVCGLIPSNETLTLKAFDQCGVEVHTQTIGPFSADTDLGSVILPAVTAVVITGDLVDCNNDAILNGYVTLNYGSDFSDVPVSNGGFMFSIIQCASQPTFTLEGVDYDAFQTTGELPYNFSNTNVGSIISCTTVTEFISLQLDNDPVVYYLNNISTGQSSSSFMNVSGDNGSGDAFYVDGSNTTLGTYDSSVYSIESSTMNIDYNQAINISYNLNAYGISGQYIDMNFSGSYTDNSGTIRNVVGSVHVLRD